VDQRAVGILGARSMVDQEGTYPFGVSAAHSSLFGARPSTIGGICPSVALALGSA
jgi:hypothetical protein